MLDLGDFFEYDTLLKVAVILSLVVLIALITAVIVSYSLAKKNGRGSLFSTRDLTYAAVCLATAFALSFIGIDLPQGGKITLASSVPIMIYCYFYGFKKGFIICTAFMLLQFLQSPVIVHPMSAVLDYVIPYLSLIMFGILSNKNKTTTENGNIFKSHSNFLIAAICYLLIRYFSHVLSGAIFYAEWAWKGWGVWAYSFAYNASFFIPDCLLATVCGMGLLASKSFYRFMAMSAYTLQNPDTAQKDNQ